MSTEQHLDAGTASAALTHDLNNPEIEAWFRDLGPDRQGKARSLFSRIDQLSLSDEERERLLTNAVVTFEALRYKEQLDALENVSNESLPALTEILGRIDEVEATLYHQITSARLAVIDALEQKVSDDVREEVIQQHLFNHLWLLDPMWERATETPYMEKTVLSEFSKIDAGLTEEERRGRLDIKYKTNAGLHVIVELKRASVQVTTLGLIIQIDKYRRALQKCLDEAGKGDEPIETVCVMGRMPTDWSSKLSKERLNAEGTRIVLYGNLIDQARNAYRDYLEKHQEAGRLCRFTESLATASS